ncbi:hypothetical protein D3C85_992190 [compost metagenome]
MASCVPARVSRITMAMFSSDSVTAGRIRWRMPSTVRKLRGMPSTRTVSPRPFDGSQPNCTANTMISIRPTQNVGSEKPRIDIVMIDFPATPVGRSPAQRPSGMPRTMASRMAVMASSMVAGMRSKISFSAGVPCANDVPRLPCKAFCRKIQYCSQSGLSSPSAAMVRLMSSWSACGLMRISTGLPIAKTPRKTSSDMTRSTTTLCIRRRMMKTSMLETLSFRRQRSPGQGPLRDGIRC